MLISFLIMLREGIEAALIVGIIASYLKQTGRGAWMPAVWLGILLAVALSLFVGASLQLASAEFPQKIQEMFEAFVGLAAAVVLTSMVFWMRRVSRSIRGELRASIDAALTGPKAGAMALISMVFLAVAREGVESAFFLLAVVQQSPDNSALLGALGGMLVSVVLGYGIYVGGVRLNLGVFFRWTGVFILVFAAGVLAGAVKSLHEAGLWNYLQQTAFDFSTVMPADSPIGTLFSGLFGYRDAPSLAEVLAYTAFLVVSLFVFLSPRPAFATARPSNS